tara:strand:- start:599 stop:1858 length:1260 start_codon:yes stop_codon:yes gene_type:complete
MSPKQLIDLKWDWRFWARPEQVAPKGDWRIWLILAGRGFGKTRTGAEYVRECVNLGHARRIALVGRTAADVRDVMVTGPSGILNCYPPEERPVYEPSKRKITFHNGAVAHCYTSEKPDQLRGPQHDLAWCDEAAAWKYPYATWDQLMFGLRLGQNPRAVVTTTPRPIQLVRDLMKSKNTAITRGSTFANRDNLAPVFLDQIMEKYQGTSLGQQEIYAELLEEIPGALWDRALIDSHRVHQPPSSFKRIVVAVDPAVSHNANSDETGIIVAGLGADGDFYVLEDASQKATVDKWARAAVTRYQLHKADRIVAEVNQGGDLVDRVLRQVDPSVSLKLIHASKGKWVRAEPVSSRYEQGRVHHVGRFRELEDQMCNYSPEHSNGSPDRLDALVYAITELDSRSQIEIRIDPNANMRNNDWNI